MDGIGAVWFDKHALSLITCDFCILFYPFSVYQWEGQKRRMQESVRNMDKNNSMECHKSDLDGAYNSKDLNPFIDSWYQR